MQDEEYEFAPRKFVVFSYDIMFFKEQICSSQVLVMLCCANFGSLDWIDVLMTAFTFVLPERDFESLRAGTKESPTVNQQAHSSCLCRRFVIYQQRLSRLNELDTISIN